MNALVIEDNLRIRSVLIRMLKENHPDVQIVGEADDVQTALELIKTKKPQLVFLDIELGESDAFDLLAQIPSDINFDIIFTTAHEQYALQAFNHAPLHYLLKPIDPEQLKEAISRIKMAQTPPGDLANSIKQILDSQKKIKISDQKGDTIVRLNDVIRFESAGRYTVVCLTDKTQLVSSHNLGKYETSLSGNGFCRVHRQHMINISHVERYLKGEGGSVILSDGSEIDVSRKRKQIFIAMLNNF